MTDCVKSQPDRISCFKVEFDRLSDLCRYTVPNGCHATPPANNFIYILCMYKYICILCMFCGCFSFFHLLYKFGFCLDFSKDAWDSSFGILFYGSISNN